MSVYFVYRSHYEGPSGKHVQRLPGDSVLGWFQDVWDRAKQAPDVSQWAWAELGCDVYGFASLFEAAQEADLRPPTTDRELEAYLAEHLYIEGEMIYMPHALQVLTDDDEIELAYYFFDDDYLGAHPGRATYLLHEDWRLPAGSREVPFTPGLPTKAIVPPGSASGATSLAFLDFFDSHNLSDLDTEGPCRIEGVRVPDLGDYLRSVQPDVDWPAELTLLKSQLSPSAPDGDEFGEALRDASRCPERIFDFVTSDRDPSKSLVRTSEHLLQLCLHVGNWFGKDVYHQWIIFDDLWAGVNKDLAEGVLRYAGRWDVLSED